MNGFASTPRASRRGFSFIEIMVALIIIGVIASLMLPVYTRLRNMAVATKTAPHMKAILAGFHDYAAAHNEYFPPAYFPGDASSSASQTGETRTGEARWLDSTIYAQVYPDRTAATDLGSAADANETSGGALGNTGDSSDNNTRDGSGGDGSHLKDTVFLVDAARLLYAAEDDKTYYDMSFCLNRSLITDSSQAGSGDWEFTPRKRSLFVDDAATMLLIEGDEGDKNSIGFGDEEQIEEGAKRYGGRYVHVGFMDGHVERTKIAEIPIDPTGDPDKEENCYFWTGTSIENYKAFEGGSSSAGKAMETYMKRR
tara:strand:- start:20512 stop:21447 length:936 start_codon:yes stop_codon:yes gene_type:complete